jgi:crotonobetainyl-CoA:carnitine CoA-transferase CaiB-like acyl-CoA transferase
VSAAPRFAQHTTEVLGELGYLEEDIARLAEQGVIGTGAAMDSIG